MKTPATVDDVRIIVENFGLFGDFTREDREKSEVIMLDESNPLFDDTINDAAEFPQLARHIGLDPCAFGDTARACAPRKHFIEFSVFPPYRRDFHTTDILLNYKNLKVSNPIAGMPDLPPPLDIPGGSSGSPVKPDKGDVVFNMCTTPNHRVYGTLIHESGHALGIRHGIDHDPSDPNYTAHHPPLADSVMNYWWKPYVPNDEPDCSPHPLDIMVIYAIYQTY